MNLPPTCGGGSQLALKSTTRTTSELLSDKISRAEADLLYQPINASGNFTSTILYTDDTPDNYDNMDVIELSESWHNFDQLWMTFGMEGYTGYVECNVLNVASTLRAIGVGANKIMIATAGASNWWMVISSSDGMTFNFYDAYGYIQMYCIEGINFN